MVTFKQKEFSPRTTKVIFKAKQAGNAIKGALRIAPKKSKVQVAREAVQLRNSLKPEAIKGRALNTALSAVKKVETAMYQPGHVANQAIEFAATKPAAAATYGVWMGKIPYVPGTTAAAVTAEKVAQKVPVYRKVTKKLGDAWRNSSVSKRLDGITGYDLSRFAQMVPM